MILKRDGSNFATWRIYMKNALLASRQECAGAVVELPDGFDEDAAVTIMSTVPRKTRTDEQLKLTNFFAS